jgi:hypothetical protein
LKRLIRQVKLIELKYQFAHEDGRELDKERLLKKAMRLGERIGQLQAIVAHQKKMDALAEKEKTK